MSSIPHSARLTQSAIERRTHIPAHVQQTMSHNLQRSLPTHLKRYQNGGSYIPLHAEKAIVQHMKKTLPGDMKKYAGAYVEQNLVHPHGTNQPPAQASTFSPAPPPNVMRKDHSGFGQQHSAEFSTLFAPDSPAPASTFAPPTATAYTQSATTTPQPAVYQATPEPQPTYTPMPEQPQAAPHPPEYDFIMNPQQPAKRFGLPGANAPLPIRMLMIAGSLLALLIVLSFIRGLIFKGPDFGSFTKIAQDQQELIHLSANAVQQKGLSTNTQNFAGTALLSLSTSQSELFKYLATNHIKVKPKVLNLKVSSKTDEQLAAAAAATIYDQTFHEIVKTRLDSYMGDLTYSYDHTEGKNGHTLLKNDYAQAELLLKQLNEPVR